MMTNTSLRESSNGEAMNIEKNDLSYLGKEVKVIIDRPIGAEHPKHEGLIYPINYGYAKGLVAGDKEGQDVYILGVDSPVTEIDVVIIAVILRKNDNEDKWVGVPKKLIGTDICYECNIREATHFQEQYYDIKIKALFEKTCGAVIYNGAKEDRKYFLIKNKSGHIGFPKGHVEYGETETETALREVSEETGLDVKLHDSFISEYTFTTLENTIKSCVFFVGEFDMEQAVKIQVEEVIGDWLLPYEEAMSKLNWEQDKAVLKKAEEFLRGNEN